MRTTFEPQPDKDGLLVAYAFGDQLQVQIGSYGARVWDDYQERNRVQLPELELDARKFAIMSFQNLFAVLGPAITHRGRDNEPYIDMILETPAGDKNINFNTDLQVMLNEPGREVNTRQWSGAMTALRDVLPDTTYTTMPDRGAYLHLPFHEVGIVYGPYMEPHGGTLPFTEPFYYGIQPR